MSEKDFVGWKLFDKVKLICRDSYNYEDNNLPLAYVVPEDNKEMLERAREWAHWVEHSDYVPGVGYSIVEEHTATEYEYDNKNFVLELYDVAKESSQGGKLSFWNCKITAPDGKQFLVGIAANLLLDVLKNTDFSDGRCCSYLMFARCKGGVGMLSETMPSYQQALRDMDTRKNLSKGKTKKPPMGVTHITPTCKNVYLGTYYVWYDPIYDEDFYRLHWYKKFIGIRRRETPKEVFFYPTYDKGRTKLSEYLTEYSLKYELEDKIPSRAVGTDSVAIDLSSDEVVSLTNDKLINVVNNKEYSQISYFGELFGLSNNKDEYTLPEEMSKALIEAGYIIE